MRRAIGITTRWLWGLTLLLAWVARPALAQSCEWASGFQMNLTVHALAVFDDGTSPALYAGGSFTTAGGVRVNNIARWNGTQWSALGSGMDGTVWALTVFNDGTGPALYAGGSFTTADGMVVNNIAKWNNTTGWSRLGSGMNNAVSALTVFDDGTGPALYAGGSFTMAGSVAVRNIAKWNGTQWSPLGILGPVSALTVFDDGTGPALYSGSGYAPRIAKWNGTQWSELGGGVSGGFPAVWALTVFDDGRGAALHAGGVFTMAGGVVVNHIAKWDGRQWFALGSGMDGMYVAVLALTVFDDGTGPALYAGGSFTSAGGVAANRIAKWNGAQWSALGSGMSAQVEALTVFDDGTDPPALYAGGQFTTAGGRPSSYMAAWRCAPRDTWSKAAPLEFGREALAATTGLDGKIYVLGGRDERGSRSLVEVFDPLLGRWSEIAPMPTPRRGLAAATGLNGRIYAIGGFSGGAYLFSIGLDFVAELDRRVVSAALQEQFRVHGFPLTPAVTVEVVRAGSDWRISDPYAITSFYVRYEGQTLNVYDERNNLDTVEVYDPSTRQWSRVAPMPSARSFLAAATGLDGRIYAFGGCSLVDVCDATNDMHAYNPVTNRWARLASMEEGRAFLAGAAGSDGRIYAIGGVDPGGDIVRSVRAYDPVDNTWSEVAPMPRARMGLAAAVAFDGTIYALGGNTDTRMFLDTVAAYDPSTDTWRTIAPMRTARRDLAAAASVVFGIESILAIGGHGVEYPLATVEILTP